LKPEEQVELEEVLLIEVHFGDMVVLHSRTERDVPYMLVTLRVPKPLGSNGRHQEFDTGRISRVWFM
jgi:hypothetical protein